MSAAPTSIRLLLAGAPQALAGGPPLPLAERDAALLAWLALEGPTPRARLMALLWPGSDATAARNSLRQRLFKLRRSIGAELVAGQETLALAEDVHHDLAEAEGVLGELQPAIGDEFAAWLERQRAVRRGRLRATLEELAAGAEAAHDWPDALAHAQELLALEPLSEAAHRRLMRLHYLAGDRAAALLAFDRCETVLKHEVGTAPSEETLALLRAVQQAGVQVPALRTPASVLRPPRLVGREAAWRTLEDAWSQPRPVLLVAEAGLGKTRLAGDFAAARGAAMAGARPGDERVPYASLSRLLRALPALPRPLHHELARLLPELGPAPPPLRGKEDRTRLLNAVAAACRGRALVFDDLHFADEASVEALRHAVAAGDARWLLTTRPAEGGPALAALREGWTAASEALTLPLAPLTVDQVQALLVTLDLPGVEPARDAPALQRRSGGNPLFLLETLKGGWRGGESALPAAAGVHALIERRITRLSPPAVQLARCAALAAPDFSIELASHVLGLRTLALADPWAELEAAQVLADGAFVHDLIFEAARASVPVPVARRLHAEIAAFLAAREGEPARLAVHWWQAGQPREAAQCWAAAADRARAAGRVNDAAGLYAQAAAAWAQAGQAAARFDALAERALLLSNDEPGADARAAIAELALLADGDLQRLRAHELQLNLASYHGESLRVVEEGPAALALARSLGDAERELRLAVVLADALADLQRAREGVLLLQPYAAAVVPRQAPDLQWEYWCSLALALDYADRLREALPAWDAARTVALAAGRSDQLWKTLANRASTEAKLGFVARAAERYGQACSMAEEGGRTQRSLQTRMVWGHRLRDCGRLADALDVLEDCRAAFARHEGELDLASTEHRLALLYQQLGQPERALPLLAAERDSLPPRLSTVRLMHRADLAHDLGRDGLPLIREALARSPDPADIYHRMATLFATRLLPPEEGEVLATGLAAWASARERLGVALAAHVRAAACALRLGAPRRARPHAEAALHLAQEHQPDSFYLPELWWVAGQVQQALGDEAAARALWRSGAEWVTQVAQVPPNFRDSFLQRNAVNRELLRRA